MAAGWQPTPATSSSRPQPGTSSSWSTGRARRAPGGGWREALERSRAFAESYSGRLEELDGDGLAAAMRELAEIQELAARGGLLRRADFSTNTADPQRGALLAHAQEQETAIQTALLFFELQWAALSDERAEQLLAGEGLDFCRHHLRCVRRYRNHLLSEPEEKVLTEK